MNLVIIFILILCVAIFLVCWKMYLELKKLVKVVKNGDQKILKNQREIKNELRYHNIINDNEPIAIANAYYSETSDINSTKDFMRETLSKG